MKYELDLISPHVAPMPEDGDLRATCQELRKVNRLATDNLIHEALLKSNRQALGVTISEMMTGAAVTLATLKQNPTVEDMVYAAKELIEDARKVLDQGLHQAEMQDVRISCVMLEILAWGISGMLDIPYHAVLHEVHTAKLENREPAIEQLIPRMPE